jgi:GNAT superfamily N-acetyltransferase
MRPFYKRIQSHIKCSSGIWLWRRRHEGTAVNESINVRAVRSDDYPQWKELWDGYNAFYGRSGETALSAEISRTTWSRFFDSYEPMHALLAEVAGRTVGLAHFLYHRSTIQISPACYLSDLFTADAARGQGVGESLIQAVYEHARSAGSPRVYWQTHETNTVAMRLYNRVAERSGFLVYRQSV